MASLSEALKILERAGRNDYRSMQTKFTKEDAKELADLMKQPSFQGMVARMSTAALQRSMLRMRGTNVGDLLKNLEDVIEKTATRNAKGGFANADIRGIVATIKTVSTLMEKNERNQELTQIQSLTAMKGLEQLERFIIQTRKGDVHNTNEDRLRRELDRQIKENEQSMLTSKNLTSVLKGQSTDKIDRRMSNGVPVDLRHLLYTALGPFGPMVKSVDDMITELKEHKELFKKGFSGLSKVVKGSVKGLTKFLGMGGRGIGGLARGLGGLARNAIDKIGSTGLLGKAGLVGGAAWVGWEIGKALNEVLPESFKEKLGNALGFLIDELPKRLYDMGEKTIAEIRDFGANALVWLKDLPNKVVTSISGKASSTVDSIKKFFGFKPSQPTPATATAKPATPVVQQAQKALAANAQAATPKLPAPQTTAKLGVVSARMEGKVGTVAMDNNGSYAYGKYQFNAKAGGLEAFFQANPEYRKKFAGLQPNTPEFNARWAELARNDPNFEDAQDKAGKQMFYDPTAAKAQAMGFNVKDRGIQEALFSQGINHSGRGNDKILAAAAATPGFATMSADQQLSALYAARKNYVQSANIEGGPRVVNSLLARYTEEEKLARSFVDQENVNRRPLYRPAEDSQAAYAQMPPTPAGGTTGRQVALNDVPVYVQDTGLLIMNTGLLG